eukprot:c24117_g7_i1 orf=790-1113(+)
MASGPWQHLETVFPNHCRWKRTFCAIVLCLFGSLVYPLKSTSMIIEGRHNSVDWTGLKGEQLQWQWWKTLQTFSFRKLLRFKDFRGLQKTQFPHFLLTCIARNLFAF